MTSDPPPGEASTLIVGRSAAVALSDLVDRAQLAERDVRAASWEEPEQIRRRMETLTASSVQPTPVDDDPDDRYALPKVADAALEPHAAELAAQARIAVTAAFQAVRTAHVAVLAAELATAEQPHEKGERPGRLRALRDSPVSRHGSALKDGVRGEVAYLLTRRPRVLLRSLLIALVGGLLYLGFVRVFEWDKYSKWTPYLAVLVLSTVMGSSACVNSMSFDAQRVRAALDQGVRLWQILVVKNLALVVVVLPPGILISALLAWRAGRPAALVAATGLVLCLILLWCGVGNILSVVIPIRDVSLKRHRDEGTFKQFLIEFAVTWTIGYAVTGMLIWRIFAAKTIAERTGSALVAALFLVLTGLVAYVLMTVVAVSLAQQPGVHRKLRKEIDGLPRPVVRTPRAAATATPPPPG